MSGATGNPQWHEGPIAQNPSNTARRNPKPDKHHAESRDNLVEISEESQKYGIWSEAQRELENFTGPLEVISGRPAEGGWALVGRYWSRLVEAACVTIALSLGSMPLAMLLGLVIAIGRIHGPIPVRAVLTGYVELIRGTPLMLQLFVLFYLLKLPPWVAGIGGLAINYSAYEA